METLYLLILIKLYPTDYTANTITNVVTLTEATAANDEVNITTVKASETTIPAMVLLASATASNDASIEFTLDNSKYSSYQVVLDSVIPATDDVALLVRFSSDGGSTFDSGAGDYQYGSRSVTATGTASDQSSTGNWGFNITNSVGNATNETGVQGRVDIIASGLGRPTIRWQIGRTNSGGVFVQNWGAGEREAIVEVNAIQFLFNVGNIASGKIHLYGLK
jgi:hypothetical protein